MSGLVMKSSALIDGCHSSHVISSHGGRPSHSSHESNSVIDNLSINMFNLVIKSSVVIDGCHSSHVTSVYVKYGD